MEKKSNGLGIASMIIGIFALLFSCCYGGFLGLIGLPLGIIGVSKPKNGTAIAGIITSGLALLITIMVMIMGNGSLVDYVERSKNSASENNISTEDNRVTEDNVPTVDDQSTEDNNLTEDMQSTEEDTQNNTEPSTETNGPEITLDEFNQIETGMTYQEVVDIIGSEGTVASESVVGDITTQMYVWYGKDKISNANFMFQNDSLISKAQLGLK